MSSGHGDASELNVIKHNLSMLPKLAGAILFLIGLAVDFAAIPRLLVFLSAYLLVGYEVLIHAGKNIIKAKVFDENLLMGVATVGAFLIGEYPEAVAVMLFYQIGEAFQDAAVDRSRRSISALMDIRPDFANLLQEGRIDQVDPSAVAPGQIIIVRPGERIPLDGVITEGRSSLDTSALTGESLPLDVSPGDSVLSGSVNNNGLLTIETNKAYADSTVARILEMTQNAHRNKAPMENFITRFARYYTPVVLALALALAILPPLVTGTDWSDWIGRALIFLVVSCPCALVISVPLSFFAGIGGASRSGILVKGGNYLEALSKVDTVVFDKTGTLTHGVFTVTDVAPADGWTREQILDIAAHAESSSNHPIAVSLRNAHGIEIDRDRIAAYEEVAGQGVFVLIDDKPVLIGNGKLMENANIPYSVQKASGTVIYLGIDGVYAGHIVISDELRPEAKRTIGELRQAGVRRIMMLTGDNHGIANKIATALSLDGFFAEQLPHQKVERLEDLIEADLIEANRARTNTKGSRKLAFVGDGINDAPVLARSDIGIALGGVGSDAAIEAADVVLMTDELPKIAQAIRISKRTMRIVWQNIIFALGVKSVILVLGAVGIASMWMAVFGDVGVTLIATINALRALRAK